MSISTASVNEHLSTRLDSTIEGGCWHTQSPSVCVCLAICSIFSLPDKEDFLILKFDAVTTTTTFRPGHFRFWSSHTHGPYTPVPISVTSLSLMYTIVWHVKGKKRKLLARECPGHHWNRRIGESEWTWRAQQMDNIIINSLFVSLNVDDDV